MSRKFALCSLLIVWVCLCSCGKHSAESGPTLVGTIRYQTAVKLPDDTRLELRLTDVSVSDGAALEVAMTTIKGLHELPYRYALPYDPAKISEQHRYTLDARIFSHGQLSYSTDSAYEVLTQGRGAQRDLLVVAAGVNEATPAINNSNASVTVFHGELQTSDGVSQYQAGLQDGHLVWLEEDRSSGTPIPVHARYELKGALIMHYTDSSSLEVKFDERGRPTGIIKQQQALKLNEHAEIVSGIRNRAELLRSHALASSAARKHRQETGG